MSARASRSKNFLSSLETLTALVVLAVPIFGQTEINLQTQGRNPDFSAMPFTRPITVGAIVPATCQVGQLFFNSSAAPGNNVYACTATNIWTSIGSNLSLPLPIANGGTGTAAPSLVAGNNITISGSWPNQTISATGSGGAGITQLTGDATAGPGTGSQAITLAAVNSTVGTFGGSTTIPVISVNAKGLVTGVSSQPILPSWGNISGSLSAQTDLETALNSKQGLLTLPLSIANGGNGTATPGLVAGANVSISGTWPNQTISATGSGGGGITQLTGDATAGPGTGSQAITLATVNQNAGTFGTSNTVPVISVNGKGLVTGVSTQPVSMAWGNISGSLSAQTDLETALNSKQNLLTLPLPIANGGTGTATPGLVAGANVSITGTWPNQTISATGSGGGGITQLIGDATAGPGTGSQAITLATVNSNVGTYGGSTAVPIITVNAKGLITAVATAPISGGGGSGAALATQLQDLAPAVSNGSITFGSSCSTTVPCLIYLNGTRYVFNSALTLSISGSANDTIYFYVDTTGTPTAGYSSANSYTGTNLTPLGGITAFPEGVYPLYQCAVSSGSFTTCSDYRPILSQTSLSNGQGTTISQSGGSMAVNLTETVDAISSANYTVPNTACGHFELSSSSSSGTWSLQQPGIGGMMPNGCVMAIKAAGSGAITIQPSNATINGASTYVIASGHVCRIVSDGTNYQTEVCQ